MIDWKIFMFKSFYPYIICIIIWLFMFIWNVIYAIN